MDYADKLDMMDDDCDIQGYPIDDCKPLITNADHIRAMSDEELAEFLIGVDVDNATLPFTNNWLDWLRQPWEEDV